MQMPDIDGLEVTRRIRRDPRLGGLAVIAMTANATVEDRQRCLAAGMNDFETKPVVPDRLYRTLGRWLPGRPRPAVLDRSRLEAILGRDAGKLGALTQVFLRTSRETLAQMAQALEAGAVPDLGRLAHKLRGSASAIGADELAAFVEAYGRAVAGAAAVVLSGSLPAGTPATLYRELLERTPCPAILDARGPELLEALPARPRLVKPNRAELATTARCALEDDGDAFAAMEGLHRRGAAWVLVTDGARPALLVGAGGRFRVRPPRPERIVNPIGCGDCLAAGFAAATAGGAGPLDAVRLGFACAADNCRLPLAGRLDGAAVARLADGVTIEPA